MNEIFKEGFEKTAKVGRLFKSMAQASDNSIMRVGKGKTQLFGPKLSTKTPHQKYLEGLGKRTPPIQEKVLKYAPSKTRAGLSEFQSISTPKKTQIAPNRSRI